MQVATEAFEVFATSVQSTSKPRNGINLIQSTQSIEEFAFKYASFNLNASNTEERKENKHIGKKTKQSVNSMLLYVLIPRLRETSCLNLLAQGVIVERSEVMLSY